MFNTSAPAVFTEAVNLTLQMVCYTEPSGNGQVIGPTFTIHPGLDEGLSGEESSH